MACPRSRRGTVGTPRRTAAKRGLGLVRTPFLGGSSARGPALTSPRTEPSPAGLRAAPRSARAAPRHRPPRASALRPEHTQTRGHSRLHCFWQTARNNCPSTRDYSESGHSKHLLPGRKRETSYGQGQTDVLPRALLPAGSAVKYAGLAAGVQMWTHQIYKKTNQ